MFKYQAKMQNVVLPHGCHMVWSYFGLGHGKGVHVGVRDQKILP